MIGEETNSEEYKQDVRIPLSLQEAYLAIKEIGRLKYGDNSVANFIKEDGRYKAIDKSLASCHRHLLQIQRGETLDEESGLPHVWHAMYRLYMVAEVMFNKEEVMFNKEEVMFNKEEVMFNKEEVMFNKEEVMFNKEEVINMWSEEDYNNLAKDMLLTGKISFSLELMYWILRQALDEFVSLKEVTYKEFNMDEIVHYFSQYRSITPEDLKEKVREESCVIPDMDFDKNYTDYLIIYLDSKEYVVEEDISMYYIR